MKTSYLQYFNSAKSKLEKALNTTLTENEDYKFSMSDFVAKYKGVFASSDKAKEAKQSIAVMQTSQEANAKFAYLLCESICVLDIDLSAENIAANITIRDVLDELNSQLKRYLVDESELIHLDTHYHILSKRGCHIYFNGKNAALNQKRSTTLKVKGEIVRIDWLARRSGKAQADFALFMPPQNILELDDEAYKECYYRKPLGDDFSLIKTPSSELADAFVSILSNSDFKVYLTAADLEASKQDRYIMSETPLLTNKQIEQSKLLNNLYLHLISLKLPDEPLLKLGAILEKESTLLSQLSQRLGGSPSLQDHIDALKSGNRLDGTSNNSMAHFINAYLLDACADLETESAVSDFNTYVETLYLLLQVSNENRKHFDKTIETYHIKQIYHSSGNAAKREAYKNASSRLTIAESSYNQENADFVNKDLAFLDKCTIKYIEEGCPIPFFDKAADKYALYTGGEITYHSTANFKSIMEATHRVRFGGKESDISLIDIPRLSLAFNPLNPNIFYAEGSEEGSAYISKKKFNLHMNLYTPSKARLKFFNSKADIDSNYIDNLDSFYDLLKQRAPYTWSLLNNLTGQDKKGIAVICSALARHLEYPKAPQHAIVLQDLGGTGKSTLAEAIGRMFGSDGVNITSDSIGSKFLRRSFENQLFTHCEDLSAAVLTSNEFTSFLKTYVGNPTIRLEEKNAKQISIKNTNLMLITTNYTGAFATENGSVNRRLTIINSATKSKPLAETEFWNEVDMDEARDNFFYEFTDSFVDVLKFSFRFLNRKEYQARYLSPMFESLTEDSKSLITPDSLATSVLDILVSKEGETVEVDGESKNKIEFNKTKLSLLIQSLMPLDGASKAPTFIELLEVLRTQKTCALPVQSVKYAFGNLGSQVAAILENSLAGTRVVRYTTCLTVDAREHKVARKAVYKAIVLWSKVKGEILPNGLKTAGFAEKEVST